MNFEGTYVAMVTPFTKEGTLDEEGFRSNINYLIDKGVNGLVGAGTTGESATMTHEEHHRVIEVLVDEINGRVDAVAGTGSNATSEALSLTEFAYDAGADAALLITPYYNKPQQHSLVNHYRTIAETCDIPLIAYNVPSRTGSNIEVDTAVELAKIDGPFMSKDDLRIRSKIGSSVMELLDKFGCLKGMPESNQLSLFG